MSEMREVGKKFKERDQNGLNVQESEYIQNKVGR